MMVKSRPEQLGSFAQVDDAAVVWKAAAHVGHPAVAEIDAAGEPLFGWRAPASGLLVGFGRCRFAGFAWSSALAGGFPAFSAGLACGRRLLRKRRNRDKECQ